MNKCAPIITRFTPNVDGDVWPAARKNITFMTKPTTAAGLDSNPLKNNMPITNKEPEEKEPSTWEDFYS